MTAVAQPSIQDLLADPSLFAAWLKARPAEDYVGQPNRIGGCPLAVYLLNNDVERPCVYRHSIRYGPAETGVWHDGTWVERFVDAVDREPIEHAITAERALTLLQRAVA